VFNSSKDLKCNINFSAVGEEGSEKLKIKNVSDSKGSKYLFSRNKIQQLNLEKARPKTIDLTIESPFKLSLKAEAHDLQQ